MWMSRRLAYLLILAVAAGVAPHTGHSDTLLSPADNAKMEAALSHCTKEMQRKLGPASFPSRTIEDIEKAITNPATEAEAQRRLEFFASCVNDNFLKQYCADHPSASQCDFARSP